MASLRSPQEGVVSPVSRPQLHVYKHIAGPVCSIYTAVVLQTVFVHDMPKVTAHSDPHLYSSTGPTSG